MAQFLEKDAGATWLVTECAENKYCGYNLDNVKIFAKKENGNIITMALPLNMAFNMIHERLNKKEDDAFLTISNSYIKEDFSLNTIYQSNKIENGEPVGNILRDALQSPEDNEKICQMLISIMPLHLQRSCVIDFDRIYLDVYDTEKYISVLENLKKCSEAETESAAPKSRSFFAQ